MNGLKLSCMVVLAVSTGAACGGPKKFESGSGGSGGSGGAGTMQGSRATPVLAVRRLTRAQAPRKAARPRVASACPKAGGRLTADRD